MLIMYLIEVVYRRGTHPISSGHHHEARLAVEVYFTRPGHSLVRHWGGMSGDNTPRCPGES